MFLFLKKKILIKIEQNGDKDLRLILTKNQEDKTIATESGKNRVLGSFYFFN